MGKIVWMRVLQFSLRKRLFFFISPLQLSWKNSCRKSIGGASVPTPLVPHQITPLLESILIYSWFISRCPYFRIRNLNWLIPVAARSNAGRSLAGTAGSKSAGGMYVSSDVRCQVEVCVGLIGRPEESNRVWYVWILAWILDNEALAH